jgi:pyruvate/2-oxoacid:ferredoxin oxidoreductase beta subunit
MENLDVILFSGAVAVAFIIFIVTCIREFSKMEKTEYKYDSKQSKYGRDAVYDMLERLFDDTKRPKEDKVKLFKTIDRTISDMEFDGMYFSEEVKEKLEKEREELFCEYSGLPSVKSYDNSNTKK